MRFSLLLTATLLSLIGCGGPKPTSSTGAKPEAVTIYAAASTKDAVEKIAKDFLAETGIGMEINPGPSSRLAKQIVEGGPGDVFLSADQANVDYLDGKKLVAQRRDLLGNELVVVVPADSKLKLEKLADLAAPDIKQLALAVEKVPAGEYAREALAKAGVWDAVKDRVAGGEDVRATLALVEQGAAAGMVYRTDALASVRVRVAFAVDPAVHKPIVYPLVLVRKEKMNPGATQLFEFLGSAKAAEVFRRAGFTILK